MRTQIIVLHRYAYGDSSWIVKALSCDIGILSLLIKGAKSKKPAFRAGIDPLAHSEIEIRYNKYKGNSSLIIPKETFLQNYFPKMRSSLQSLALAQLMAEILLKLGNEKSLAAAEFNWLLNNLKSLELNAIEENSLSIWLHKLCDILGYAPMLSKCSRCGEDLLNGPADLWPSLGGAICKTCLGTRKPGYDPNSWRHIENFFLAHLKVHTNALDNLKTWEWVAETRRLAG